MTIEIIDTHSHVISPDRVAYPLAPLGGKQSDWSSERPTPHTALIAAMDAAGVHRAIVVQASTAYGHDNSYAAEAIAAHPGRFAGVFSVDVLAPDAEACIVMGDLVEHFVPEAYAALVDGLRPLAMPVRLMMGNHDERAMLRDAWPALDDDGDGFAQAAIHHADGVVLLLDTSEPGTHEGAYCLKRQAWLTRALEAAGEAPVLVCMHHPPMALGTWSDRSRQRDHEALGAILAGSGKVRHMLMGHTHRACSGTWHGIGYTVLHGIGPQNVLRWGSDERPDFQDGPAHVAIVDFAGGDVRVHVTDVTGHHRVWPRPPA